MPKMINKRTLTPYEKNQLLKHNIDFKILVNTDAPVEYLTGHVDFMKLDFVVHPRVPSLASPFTLSPSVLIPRIETEELVERVVEEAKKINDKNPKKTLRIIDVGTGSGAVAISVAKKLAGENPKLLFKIIGADVSEKALNVAKRNLKNIDAGGELPVKFLKSNLLSEINKADLIVANLPYIPSKRIKNLDSSVKDFEPHLALDGGTDGLNLVRKLLKQATPMLSEKGIILLELDITHTQEKMKEFEGDWQIDIIESEFGGVNFGLLSKLHYH